MFKIKNILNKKDINIWISVILFLNLIVFIFCKYLFIFLDKNKFKINYFMKYFIVFLFINFLFKKLNKKIFEIFKRKKIYIFFTIIFYILYFSKIFL